MSGKPNLNDKPVGWALFRVSAPMSIGIFGVLMVGLADAFFLARYGDFALTAVGFIYPVTMTLTSLSIGLSAGTSTVVSQALGRGEEEGKQRTTMHAMLMGLALWSWPIGSGSLVLVLVLHKNKHMSCASPSTTKLITTI